MLSNISTMDHMSQIANQVALALNVVVFLSHQGRLCHAVG